MGVHERSVAVLMRVRRVVVNDVRVVAGGHRDQRICRAGLRQSPCLARVQRR
jgi:hypothetical protein